MFTSIVSRVGRTARVLPVIGLMAGLTSVAPAMAATSSASASGPLSVSQTASGPAVTGQAESFSITVANTSDGPANNVFLGDQLPVGARLTGPLPNPNFCAKGGSGGVQGFACLIGTLGPAGSGTDTFTINFSVIANVAGNLDNRAVSTGFVNGSFFTNSVDLLVAVSASGGVTTTTSTNTDVQVTGFSSTNSPRAGVPFFYVFQVKNNGPQVANSVSFSDTLPAGDTLLGTPTAFSLNGSGSCTTSGNSVSCTLGDLGVGTSAVVAISATAPSVSGTYTNVASVTEANTDTNPSNNTVGVTIQVK